MDLYELQNFIEGKQFWPRDFNNIIPLPATIIWLLAARKRCPLFHFQYTVLAGLNINPLNFKHTPITSMPETGILSQYKITDVKCFFKNNFLTINSKILKLIKK